MTRKPSRKALRSAEHFATNAARDRDIAAHPATPSGGPFPLTGYRVFVRFPGDRHGMASPLYSTLPEAEAYIAAERPYYPNATFTVQRTDAE